MRLHPHHIGLVVSDLDDTTAFYEALGFRIASDMPADDGSRAIRFLELDGFQIELFWYAQDSDQPLEPAPAPAGKGRLGFRHLALRTSDIDGVLSTLKASGLAPDDLEVRTVPLGFRLVFITDPDGIEIEIMQEA